MFKKKYKITYIRLLLSIQPYKKIFLLSIIGTMIYSLTDAIMYKFLKPLIDKGFIERDVKFLNLLPGAIIGLFFFRGISSFFTNYFMGFISRHIVMNFRRKILKHIMNLPHNFFSSKSSGELLSKINYDIEQISDALSHGITSGIRGIFLSIALLYVMFNINFKVTLILLMVCPILVIYVKYISKRMYFYSKNIQKTMGVVTALAEEIIFGQKVIKTFNGFNHSKKKINYETYKNCKQEMNMIYMFSTSIPFMQIIGAISLSILIYLATLEKNHYLGTGMTAGEFTAIFSAAIGMLRPIKQIAIVNSILQKGLAGANSIFNLLDEISEKNPGKKNLLNNRINISISDMSIFYTNRKKKHYILDNINLNVKFGKKIAIIGKSGSGKTTLISTLLCFLQNYSGKILYNENKMNIFDKKSIRSKFSIVSQDVFLFDGSILSNIIYGCNKKIKRLDIINAAKMASSLEFIESLPKGFNTLIGKNGVNLSGGQKQRLSIIRAILKNTSILILDEATSSIDIESEIHIKQSLYSFFKYRTVIIIAHRVNTIKDIKSIYILENGKLVKYNKNRYT